MADLRTIKSTEIGNFKIDESTNKLYWNDKAIKSENLTLSGGQKLWAFMVAASAVVAALATANSEFCVIETRSCKNVVGTPVSGKNSE